MGDKVVHPSRCSGGAGGFAGQLRAEAHSSTLKRAQRGGALLAVLWLSAALAAIAFSLATTVRGEIERTSTALDGARAYYLAQGALERALVYMQWGPRFLLPDGSPRYYAAWMTQLRFLFPTGEAAVEILPESSKLDINRLPPEDLLRLLMVLGAGPDQAAVITRGILDWRNRPPEGRLTEFDRYYLSLTPSFRPRHASFQEIEELLLVKGMTPELFYGSIERDPQGRLAPRTGLQDCVSVYGSGPPVDVNTTPPAVLAAIGLGPGELDALVRRRQRPFHNIEQLRALGLPFQLMSRLTVGGGGGAYTLRSTARLRLDDGKLSDLKRAVGATVVYGGSGSRPGFQILRWQDRIWAQNATWTQEPSSR